MHFKFPYRQVHLDFHTWGDIPNIGKNFTKESFQAALKAGNVDSITVFAKCNMGYCYYPTKVGVMHPHLKMDLTTAMVEAAHEIGVRAPIYINAGLNEEQAAAHPEWHAKRAINGDAKWCDFTLLCLNDGTWANVIYKLCEEVCLNQKELDGLFLDIALIDEACYCPECIKGMVDMGLDYRAETDAKKYYTLKRKAFMNKCRSILHKYHPNATIFFNSGGAEWQRPEYHENSTHFEMEDLPTAWGGYDKLPLRAKYFSKKNKPYLAMTGKFHLNWGEFGGYKSRDALKFEICSMALYGAACSIGDHMHPDGVLDLQTYQNIGYAYNYLEKIAPYCYGGEDTATLGIYPSFNEEECSGISELLLSSGIDYGVVINNDYSGFDTVIFPGGVSLQGEELAALKGFISRGGRVLVFADALLEGNNFAIDLGVEYLSAPTNDCDYIMVPSSVTNNLPNAPLLSYYCGLEIKAAGCEVIAERLKPYFSRTDGIYCDDRQVPYNPDGIKLPAAVKKGNVVYCCHPLATVYHQFGNLNHRNYFLYLLDCLGYQSRFTISGWGSSGRATLIKQPQNNRYCLNMVYAIPTKRGSAEVIEDITPIYNLKVEINLPENIKRAYLPLSGEELQIQALNNKQSVILPKLHCHETLVFEY